MGAASQQPEPAAYRDGVGGAGATLPLLADQAQQLGWEKGLRLSLAVDALCDAIKENHTIRYLGLAHNALGDHGALAVLPAAMRSRSLTEIDMRANGLSVHGLGRITNQLAAHRAMVSRRALTGSFSTGYQPVALSRLPLPCRSSYDCEATSWYKAVEGRFEAKRIARAHLCALVPPTANTDQPSAAAANSPSMTTAATTASPSLSSTHTSLAAISCPDVSSTDDALPVLPPPMSAKTLAPLEATFSARRVCAKALCPFYMCRQVEVNASMRRILINWLVELYDELEMPVDVLLQAVHQVDRFLSTHAVPKETLQLVGAVALMIANNHFCKLPHQDGERPAQEHGLNHAEDIVYWTDGTYRINEVLTMESRLLGFEIGEADSSWTISRISQAV